ncbi:hypothetical protein BDV12DRAFT_200832 [Aspergillus spectabilis]
MKQVSALIIGGGPVDLLIAYQLARSGCSVHIIDKENKLPNQDSGRANALYSRSAEILDQLGLVDDLLQECHVCRESYTYDSEGERVIHREANSWQRALAPLDQNMTRIGYVFTPEQEARHSGILAQEAAVQEAIAAVKSSKLEFETSEWWTL